MIGLFALLSYQVASRTRELGVRMALGAQRYQVLFLVLKNGIALTAIGLALGITGSLALGSAITSVLSDAVGISPTSSLLGGRTMSIAVSVTFMLIAAVLASLIPAQRAASVNPTEALRAE